MTQSNIVISFQSRSVSFVQFSQFEFLFCQDNIWFTRLFFIMQSKSESVDKKKLSDHNLGFSVFPFDLAHVITTGQFVMNICNYVKLTNKYTIENSKQSNKKKNNPLHY
jgi:hypothetical protein